MQGTQTFYRAADIQAAYKKKLITSDEAAGLVQTGYKVHLGTFGDIAREFENLWPRKRRLDEVIIYSSLWSYDDTYETKSGSFWRGVQNLVHPYEPEDRRVKTAGHAGIFRSFTATIIRCGLRTAKISGYGGYHGRSDGFLRQFQSGGDYRRDQGIIQAAKTVVVEVNENMPRCNGIENYINIAEVDYITESTNYPIAELPVREAGGADAKIAELILPSDRRRQLSAAGRRCDAEPSGQAAGKIGFKNLSVHTEMLVDAFVDLYEEGKISGIKNAAGKMVYTFALGTRRLYDFLTTIRCAWGAGGFRKQSECHRAKR